MSNKRRGFDPDFYLDYFRDEAYQYGMEQGQKALDAGGDMDDYWDALNLHEKAEMKRLVIEEREELARQQREREYEDAQADPLHGTAGDPEGWAAYTFDDVYEPSPRWSKAHYILEDLRGNEYVACGRDPSRPGAYWAHEDDANVERCKFCERLVY